MSSDWDKNVTKRRVKKQPDTHPDQIEFNLGLFERQRSRISREITERIGYIDRMLQNVVSSDLVKNELEVLNSAFGELLLVCEKLRPLVQDIAEFDLWLGSVDTDIFLIKNSAIRYITQEKLCKSHHVFNRGKWKNTLVNYVDGAVLKKYSCNVW